MAAPGGGETITAFTSLDCPIKIDPPIFMSWTFSHKYLFFYRFCIDSKDQVCHRRVPRKVIFPSGMCAFDGEKFPCPRLKRSFLRYQYGPNWDVSMAKYGKSTEEVFSDSSTCTYILPSYGKFTSDGMYVFLH